MYRRITKYKEALVQFTKVMEQLPDDQTVYIERGRTFQDMENHHDAIADF